MYRCPDFACDLVCLEPGQELSAAGRCAYYIVAGSGDLKAGKATQAVKMGLLATCDDGETHRLVNSSEQRLIFLAIAKHS